MRISIVTAVLNGGDLLARTIESVLNQNYSDLEYIIVDGGSLDDTTRIIKLHESRLAYWTSEHDSGLYDALNKGFQRATGDVMAWLNAGDTYYPWTLAAVKNIFDNNNVKWIAGRASGREEGSRSTQLWGRRHYPRALIRAGYCHGKGFGFIPQESTFWTRDLWEQAGAYVDSTYQLAGDHELWTRFARYSELRVFDVPLGTFCVHAGQLSESRSDEYYREIYSRYGPGFKSVSFLLKCCRAGALWSRLKQHNQFSYIQ